MDCTFPCFRPQLSLGWIFQSSSKSFTTCSTIFVPCFDRFHHGLQFRKWQVTSLWFRYCISHIRSSRPSSYLLKSIRIHYHADWTPSSIGLNNDNIRKDHKTFQHGTLFQFRRDHCKLCRCRRAASEEPHIVWAYALVDSSPNLLGPLFSLSTSWR